MRDNQKTKDELLQEMETLRRRVSELEGNKLEHKQAEKALRESEEKYRCLTESLDELVYRADPNTFVATYVNNAVERFYGYSVEQWLREPNLWEDLIHPDDRERALVEFTEAHKELKSAVIEYRIIKKNKEVRWVKDHVSWEKDQQGKVVSMNGIVYDTTERKQAEEEVKKFKEMTERATLGCAMADLNGNLTYINESFAKMHGYTPARLIGKNLKIFHTDAQMKRVGRLNKRLVETGEGIQGEEVWHVHRDGTEFPTLMSNWVLKDLDGNPYLMCGTAVSITDRKLAEDALRESEERHKALFQGAAEGIIVADTETKEFKYANPAICKMLGYTEDELEQMGVRDIHPKEDLEYIISEFEAQARGEKTLTSNIPCLRKDGTIMYADINTALVSIDGRKCNVGFFTNITDRKKAEDEVLIERNKLKAMLGAMECGVTIRDLDYTLIYQNNYVTNLFGKRIGEKCYRVFQGIDKICDGCPVELAIKEGKTHTSEKRVSLPSGEVTFWENTASPIRDADGNIISCLEINRNITERKRAEDALRESEKRFREIFENTAVGVYRTTPDGKILMANPALVQMLGYSSFEELSQRNLEQEGFEPQYQRSMFIEEIEREERIVSSESIWITQDGKRLYVIENSRAVRDKDGKTLYYEGTVENITKSKQAEEELDMFREKMVHAERLASLGTLSATMVHKLNQPLTTIRLSIENSLAELQTISCPSIVIEDIKDGLSAVSEVASTVDSFRNFARKSSKDIISEVNLNAVAERILNLLNESARRARVSLQIKGMDKLPPLRSNEKDLEQLFFALVENAIQAADGKKSCRLIISGNVKHELIELRFTDDCGGIEKKNLEKIFEPFFTTRPVNERTGLGLCIVEHIVSGAGGKVYVESKAGKGSTFFVTLPFNNGMS
jgi:PAS domain S-box-containing protein